MLHFLYLDNVVYAWYEHDMTQCIQIERAVQTCRRDINILYWKWKETPVMLPCPGGVIVMVCAVNSSSKYRVSVSEVTWGLNGGTSCWSRAHTETYQNCPTVVLLMTICKVSWKASHMQQSLSPGVKKYLSRCHCSLDSESSKATSLTQVKKNSNFESIIVFSIRFDTHLFPLWK